MFRGKGRGRWTRGWRRNVSASPSPSGAKLGRASKDAGASLSSSASEIWQTDNFARAETTDTSGNPNANAPKELSLWRRDEGASKDPSSVEPVDLWSQPQPPPAPSPPREAPAPEPPTGTKRSPSTSARPRQKKTPATKPESSKRISEDRPRTAPKTGIRRRLRQGVFVVLLLLILDAAYVGFGLLSDLRSARSELLAARTALSDGEIDAARVSFDEALDRSRSAESLQDHPAFWLASIFPDAEVVKRLTSAAELGAQSGLIAMRGADALGLSDRSAASSVYAEGRVDFDAVDEAARYVGDIQKLVAQARDALAGAQRPVLDILDDALGEARAEVADAESSVLNGSRIFSVLPGLFGEGGPRRYLLVFQALGEARATGGVFGFYGVLEARDGQVNLGHVATVKELDWVNEDAPEVESPKPWYELNYEPQFALRQVQQVNTSPSFPVVSEVLLRMYEAQTGASLDGVVAMDPVSLEYLLRGTGPIQGSGFDEPITSDNAAEVVLHDSYVRFDSDAAQNAFLAGLLRSFWRRIGSDDVDPGQLAAGLSDAVATQHFKIYSRTSKEQRTIGQLGVSGDPKVHGNNVQMVFHNNYGLNKVDYFLQREIETHILLSATGGARVVTTVRLENQAPAGPPSPLLVAPENENGKPGLNQMFFNILLPKGARPHSYRAGPTEKTIAPLEYGDAGYPVVWDLLRIPPGEETEVEFTYFLDASTKVADGDEFDFTLFPQAVVAPDRYTFLVSAPEGIVVEVDGSSSARTYTSSGILDRPKQFSMSIRDE